MQIVRPLDVVPRALVSGLLAVLVGVVVANATESASLGATAGLALWVTSVAWGLRKAVRRWSSARTAFPTSWRDWLIRSAPFYRALDGAGQLRFERDVRWSLDELQFEAAGGASVDDDLRLSVAAGAAMLLHGHPDWDVPTGRTILFVPGAFDEAYGEEEDGLFDGMVHAQGPVVLSAEAVRTGWRREDGLNVVLHELAHLFDFDGWDADGIPAFVDPRSADAWTTLMRDEMRKARVGRSVLRSYAASAPAELFAVATEQFYERPARLRKRHPELFEALRTFYNVTPPDEADPESGGSFMARRWDATEDGSA